MTVTGEGNTNNVVTAKITRLNLSILLLSVPLCNWRSNLVKKFYLDHLILHLELHFLSLAMWGAAVLVEWLSPGHYLYFVLQTLMGYQLLVCV